MWVCSRVQLCHTRGTRCAAGDVFDPPDRYVGADPRKDDLDDDGVDQYRFVDNARADDEPAPTTTRAPVFADGDDVGEPWGDHGPRVADVPRQSEPDVPWRGPGSPAAADRVAISGFGDVWCLQRIRRDPTVVWHRVGGATGGLRARWAHVGGVRRVRLPVPFRRRRDRSGDHAAVPTGDLAKGTVTIDPDGYPLVYGGSRDNKLRVLAIDREAPVELWALDSRDPALQPRLWNNGLGCGSTDHRRPFGDRRGEQPVPRGPAPSQLRRRRAGTGGTRAHLHGAGWDDELLANLPDDRVSVENAVTMVGDVAYFTSSGGLVQGWDLTSLRTGRGEITRSFRFWTGDDSDATIVADAAGALYVGQEWDRRNERGREIGQLLKVDPSNPDDPVVWSIADQFGDKSGTWSTPALYRDTIIWPTYTGPMYGIDRATGAVRWTIELPYAVLSSPVVIDDVLMQADATGVVHAWDLTARGRPAPLWSVQLPANIESTPALWKGRLYVGTRTATSTRSATLQPGTHDHTRKPLRS